MNKLDNIKVERITTENNNFFFGYYDISPESPCGRYILAAKAPFLDRMPLIGDNLEIGYFENGSENFHYIDSTDAWNFQEGCRLQWLSDTQCIYNIRNKSEFGANIYDISNCKIIRKYDHPIYSISKKYNVATSYSFINNKYNYPHKKNDELNDKYSEGVYILDLNTNEYKLIISLNKLIDITKTSHCKNWVEYCCFDPSGNHFYIYHRWNDNHGDAGTHLCIGNIHGNIQTLLISRSISHAGWKGENQITAWCRIPSTINVIQRNSIICKSIFFKIAKNIFHKIIKKPSIRQKITNDAYITFNINSSECKKIDNSEFISDGHCTWSKNLQFMLTDTYPDENNNRNLLLFDEYKNQIFHLGSYYSYPRGMEKKNHNWNISPMRCDLHPKWSMNEQYIYFDSVHEGYRGLYRIDVSNLLKN